MLRRQEIIISRLFIFLGVVGIVSMVVVGTSEMSTETILSQYRLFIFSILFGLFLQYFWNRRFFAEEKGRSL